MCCNFLSPKLLRKKNGVAEPVGTTRDAGAVISDFIIISLKSLQVSFHNLISNHMISMIFAKGSSALFV